MSCIVLDFGPADKNVIKELGVLVDGEVQGYSFRPPKRYKATKQAFNAQKGLARICVEQWTFGLQSAFKHSS